MADSRSAQSSKIVQWAVLEPGRWGRLHMVKGPFSSREEAEAWCTAMKLSRANANAEHFAETSGIVNEPPLVVGSREVTEWGRP